MTVDISRWWDGGDWEDGTEQWWVWDGAEWQAATEAYVWDGSQWVLIFPNPDLADSLSEAVRVFTHYGLTKRDREQQYDASEVARILDRYVLDKQSRAVQKVVREFVGVSELIALVKRIQLSETASILDRYVLEKESRIVEKVAREFLGVAESGITDKDIPLNETANILDRYVLEKEDRFITKVVREFIGVTESMADEVAPPVIASAEISGADEAADGGRCRFATGDFCESAIVEYRVNGGSWTSHANVNTSPNTSDYLTAYVTGLVEDDELQFRVRPFLDDGQTGLEGTAVLSNVLTIGVE